MFALFIKTLLLVLLPEVQEARCEIRRFSSHSDITKHLNVTREYFFNVTKTKLFNVAKTELFNIAKSGDFNFAKRGVVNIA